MGVRAHRRAQPAGDRARVGRRRLPDRDPRAVHEVPGQPADDRQPGHDRPPHGPLLPDDCRLAAGRARGRAHPARRPAAPRRVERGARRRRRVPRAGRRRRAAAAGRPRDPRRLPGRRALPLPARLARDEPHALGGARARLRRRGPAAARAGRRPRRPGPRGRARPVSRQPDLPGTVQTTRRFRPEFHYELIACGLRGHELVGMDAADVRPEDAPLVRAAGGLRWYRCLRCDSWLPLEPPEKPQHRYPPGRAEIELPLRGKALRDKVVLRLIAVDRALHFVVLAFIALAIFIFAAKQATLRDPVYRVLADFEGGVTPARDSQHGFLHELHRLFSIETGTLTKVGLIVAAYAILEGLEALGLWWQKRWAEYLTFIATALLLPLEIYELTRTLSPLKLITLALNLAVVVYLLVAKRLFGLRGGAAAEARARERDGGWPALDRATPEGTVLPA